MILHAERISVERGRRTVLRDITLKLDAPGCTALVGPNGAGKTTLLQTVVGLIVPASGAIRLDGRELRSISRREIARHISYVPQNAGGFGGFTVEQTVAAARFPHRHPLEPLNVDDDRKIRDALVACGLTDLAGRSLDTLSGGERQKVWIAGALAQDAPIMLLDEPAASLDPKHQADLIGVIHTLVAAGKTILVVAHDLNLAVAAAQRIIAIRGGQLVFDGATGAFLRLDLLREIFEAPFDLVAAPGRTMPYVNLRAQAGTPI